MVIEAFNVALNAHPYFMRVHVEKGSNMNKQKRFDFYMLNSLLSGICIACFFLSLVYLCVHHTKEKRPIDFFDYFIRIYFDYFIIILPFEETF